MSQDQKKILPSWAVPIKERHEKSTKGLWYVDESPQFREQIPHPDGVFVDEATGTCSVIDESSTHYPDDMRFVANAHQDIPRLLQAYTQALVKLERAKELLGGFDCFDDLINDRDPDNGAINSEISIPVDFETLLEINNFLKELEE